MNETVSGVLPRNRNYFCGQRTLSVAQCHGVPRGGNLPQRLTNSNLLITFQPTEARIPAYSSRAGKLSYAETKIHHETNRYFFSLEARTTGVLIFSRQSFAVLRIEAVPAHGLSTRRTVVVSFRGARRSYQTTISLKRYEGQRVTSWWQPGQITQNVMTRVGYRPLIDPIVNVVSRFLRAHLPCQPHPCVTATVYIANLSVCGNLEHFTCSRTQWVR